MKNHKIIFLSLLFPWILFAWTQSAHAAFVSTNIGKSEISIAESTFIEIILDLDLTEQASTFEGRFDLVGFGTVASASLSEGGPTWSSSFGNITGDQAVVSLTSSNQGGNRLVATFDITGLSTGVFEIILAQPTEASFDLDVPPFIQDLNITNLDNSTLATIKVVPLPPALGLLMLSVGVLRLFTNKYKG